MKDQKQKISKVDIKNKVVLRNEINQRMKLWKRSAIRSVNKVKQFVLENHKNHVVKLESAPVRTSEKG